MLFNNFKIINKTFIKGKGQDTVGQFEIVGSIVPGTNQVGFLKQYIGQHSVEYSGTISKDKKEINGTWAMPAYNMSDTFQLKVRLFKKLTDVFIFNG